MAHIEQLLAKAMSTSSEEEAISCLKMARKHGNSVVVASNTYNGKTAQYWHDSIVALSKEYSIIRDNYRKLNNVKEKRTKELEDTIVRLYVAIPAVIGITGIISYMLFHKTITASCWFF